MPDNNQSDPLLNLVDNTVCDSQPANPISLHQWASLEEEADVSTPIYELMAAIAGGYLFFSGFNFFFSFPFVLESARGLEWEHGPVNVCSTPAVRTTHVTSERWIQASIHRLGGRPAVRHVTWASGCCTTHIAPGRLACC